MPFKPHAARRHRIPKARYRVTNWPAYGAGLRRRGDLSFWLDDAALDGTRRAEAQHGRMRWKVTGCAPAASARPRSADTNT